MAAAIAAGGWVVLLIILIVCLVAMLLSSVFGIFFSCEDTGSGQTLQDAVLEIQTDYQDTIETLKEQNVHDVVEISGAQIDWPEILAVYAVKTGSTQEVATMDDAKKGELRSVFWDTALRHPCQEKATRMTMPWRKISFPSSRQSVSTDTNRLLFLKQTK